MKVPRRSIETLQEEEVNEYIRIGRKSYTKEKYNFICSVVWTIIFIIILILLSLPLIIYQVNANLREKADCSFNNITLNTCAIGSIKILNNGKYDIYYKYTEGGQNYKGSWSKNEPICLGESYIEKQFYNDFKFDYAGKIECYLQLNNIDNHVFYTNRYYVEGWKMEDDNLSFLKDDYVLNITVIVMFGIMLLCACIANIVFYRNMDRKKKIEV